MLQKILFDGVDFPFKRENPVINLGVTFGFLKEKNGIVAVSNRIFETQLYDTFLSEMAINEKLDYIEEFSLKINVDTRIYKIFQNLDTSDSMQFESASQEISKIESINANQRQKKLFCRPMLEFTCLLYVYKIVVSDKVKYHRIKELNDLFFNRMTHKKASSKTTN